MEVSERHRLKPLICCRWPALISGRRASRLIPGVVVGEEVEEDQEQEEVRVVGGGRVCARAVHQPL